MPKVSGARRRVVALAAVGLLVASLSALAPSMGAAQPPPIDAGGSVNQVYAVDLAPGEVVELIDGSDGVVSSALADTQGAILFREVTAGSGYRVRQGARTSGPLIVTTPDDHPPGGSYEGITVGEGYGYLPTRDGTSLSVNVHFPTNGSAPPWPVVVNYSGYDPSAPGGPPGEAVFFQLQGYAVVGVNMRGTGCSGGAFDYFEPLQSTDGFDVIEAVARQPWSNGDVGMIGVSYPGISQLFVAKTRPPHLRAITPLSVIADTYRSTLYPGGILNSGFALDWATDRVDSARPAARAWARNRINGGDQTCADNQKLRLQSRDLLAEIQPFRFYEAAGDELSPRTFVDQIDVPVYISGQFQDEQTGGHWSTMLSNFSPGTKVRAVLTNGTHAEPLGPEQALGVLEFVDFYVGKRKPQLNPLIRLGAASAYAEIFETSNAFIPADRFTSYPTYQAALAAYESEPPVRILWENGAGRNPGEPFATAITNHSTWPPPSASPHTWFLHPDGRLDTAAPTLGADEPRGISVYEYDPSTKRPSTFDGGSDEIWKRFPDVHWEPLAEGHALSFVSQPFGGLTAMAGTGSVDLWLRSDAADTDLEVTLTEVRPDGQERYIQSGWLRASHRALDGPRSTALSPFHTHTEADAQPLPVDEFVPVRVALFPFTHVFRAGSRLRLNVEAPGGNQPFWEFAALDDTHGNAIAHSADLPSKVVLPVLGAAPPVTAALPACPSIRNQPCRPYLPDRVPTDVVAADDQAAALLVTWQRPERPGPVSAYEVAISELDDDGDDGDDEAEHGGEESPAGDQLDATGRAGITPAAGGEVPAPVHVAQVAGDVTSYRFTGAEKGVRYVATVQALYGSDAGPVSNASASAVVGDPVPPTAPPPAAPPGDPTADPADAGEEAASTTGRLPRTGLAVAWLVALATMLVVLGATLVAVRSRLRPPPPGGP